MNLGLLRKGRLVTSAVATAIVAAAEASTVSTAEATATSTACAALARRTITLRARHGNGEHAPVHFLAVPTVDSSLGLSLVYHLDETESARAAGHAIADNADGRYLTSFLESGAELVLGRAVRDTADIELV